MNAIQTEENSVLNSPAVFEKVKPTISKCFSSVHACAWGDIIPLNSRSKIYARVETTLTVLNTELSTCWTKNYYEAAVPLFSDC